MLAALLNWPQATFAAKVEPVDGNKVGQSGQSVSQSFLSCLQFS